MEKHKIFISSAQKEFKEERKALCDYLRQDCRNAGLLEPEFSLRREFQNAF